jgi:signal transduction histidine kinase
MSAEHAELPRGQTFQEHLAEINRSAVRLGYVLVATLMPAGFTLDYMTHPDHMWSFWWIRLGASAVALGLLALTYVEPLYGRARIVIDSLMPLIPAASIEVMICELEGIHSEYYAGLNLVILAMAILFTWTWRHALVVNGIIVAMWILPAIPVIAQGEVRWSTVFNNAYFVSLTVVIATSAVTIRYRTVQREFEARKALAETSAELAGTLAQLREADRLKNEFFANVSHELRTPLTLIMAPIDEMLVGAGGALAARLDVVRRNASRLLRMIDDLLDLARLDGGRLRLHVAPLDLADVARRVIEAARPTADHEQKALTLEAEAPPMDLYGDPHRIEIVLTNLVGNALKFTPEGGAIHVRVRADGERAVVDVEDSGQGIAADQHERIFERFYQIYGSERRRHGGAGLGLSLARDLARLHRGDLTVSSELGRGATFRLFLPLGADHVDPERLERRPAAIEGAPPERRAGERAGSSQAVAAAPARADHDHAPPILFERGRRARILIAEDEDDLRDFLASVLGASFEVVTAGDGAEALRLARATRPDLVLTDVMMPGTSGTDLCRELKADRFLRATPVIMLTARTGTDAALAGYDSGADDFVAKPFHVKVLLARIRAHLTLRSLTLQIADHVRLESAGLLAAGVAHEVRNPMNAVISAARLLEKAQDDDAQRRRLLEVLLDGVRRIDQVVSALDAHARPADGGEATACSVRDGVESTVRLLAHRCDGVAIHRHYASDDPVRAPARAFNQILLNLLDNAVRAGGKNVWVRVISDEDELVVSVEDDGSGISPDHAGHLFDPFFTARGSGDGTGLGLFLSHRLARACGGDLGYRPRAAGGAEFVVRLPRLEVPA